MIVPEGRYLLRFTTEAPAVLKVTVSSGAAAPAIGGFDLDSPVCLAIALGGEVRIEARPLGMPPAWIAFSIEETARDVSPGPGRWRCEEPGGGA